MLKRITAPVAAGIGLFINLLLFFTKLYIGLSSNSISIYADALNNLLDCLGCSVAFAGIVLISKKKSKNYPFGFGKSSDITDFILAVSVTLTAAYFFYISLERFLYPTPIWYSLRYAVAIGCSALVKLLLFAVFKGSSEKLKSSTLSAMAKDSLLDFFITVSVLVSFTVSEYVGYSVDGICGILVSVIMFIEGIKLLKVAASALLGKKNHEICNEMAERLESIGIKAEEVNCHFYGSKKIFTIKLSEGEYAKEKLSDITFEENEEVYFSII